MVNCEHYETCAKCGCPLAVELTPAQMNEEVAARRVGMTTFKPHGVWEGIPYVTNNNLHIPVGWLSAEERAEKDRMAKQRRENNPEAHRNKVENKKFHEKRVLI